MAKSNRQFLKDICKLSSHDYNINSLICKRCRHEMQYEEFNNGRDLPPGTTVPHRLVMKWMTKKYAKIEGFEKWRKPKEKRKAKRKDL